MSSMKTQNVINNVKIVIKLKKIDQITFLGLLFKIIGERIAK